MTYDQYLEEVVRIAKEQLKPKVCGINATYVREYYEQGLSVEDAADLVVAETIFWIGDW